MKPKRICKATSQKGINRAAERHQHLWKTFKGTISAERLNYCLSEIEKLPFINRKVHFIHNRHGVLVETIGKQGNSKKIGVANHGGVVYFDGNRIGKKKLLMYKSLYNLDLTKQLNDSPNKVWNKIGAQGSK